MHIHIYVHKWVGTIPAAAAGNVEDLVLWLLGLRWQPPGVRSGRVDAHIEVVGFSSPQPPSSWVVGVAHKDKIERASGFVNCEDALAVLSKQVVEVSRWTRQCAPAPVERIVDAKQFCHYDFFVGRPPSRNANETCVSCNQLQITRRPSFARGHSPSCN